MARQVAPVTDGFNFLSLKLVGYFTFAIKVTGTLLLDQHPNIIYLLVLFSTVYLTHYLPPGLSRAFVWIFRLTCRGTFYYNGGRFVFSFSGYLLDVV